MAEESNRCGTCKSYENHACGGTWTGDLCTNPASPIYQLRNYQPLKVGGRTIGIRLEPEDLAEGCDYGNQ